MLGKYLARRARWNWQKPRIYAIPFFCACTCFNEAIKPLIYLPVVNRAGIIQNLLKDAAESIHVALVGYHIGVKVS